MKAALNRIAALLGYVPAPAKPIAVVCKLKFNFDYDRVSVDEAIERLTLMKKTLQSLEELQQTFEKYRQAVAALNAAKERSRPFSSAADQFATTELRADETQALILAELRKQNTLLEVLAKQGDRAAKYERFGPPYAGTGSSSVIGSSCLASASPPPSERSHT